MYNRRGFCQTYHWRDERLCAVIPNQDIHVIFVPGCSLSSLYIPNAHLSGTCRFLASCSFSRGSNRSSNFCLRRLC